MAQSKSYVIGVGMTKFERPNVLKWDYPDMAYQAGEKQYREQSGNRLSLRRRQHDLANKQHGQ